MTVEALVFLLVFLPMILEAGIARRHEQVQRARGGREPAGDVYRIMQVAYPAAFLSMIGEALARGQTSIGPASAAGLATFVVSKALKWWAIYTLGDAWTFRVIAVPGTPLVTAGPYRCLRHPNYVAVAGELIGVALLSGAWIAGPIATALFVALMVKRARLETRALDAILAPQSGSGASLPTREVRPH